MGGAVTGNQRYFYITIADMVPIETGFKGDPRATNYSPRIPPKTGCLGPVEARLHIGAAAPARSRPLSGDDGRRCILAVVCTAPGVRSGAAAAGEPGRTNRVAANPASATAGSNFLEMLMCRPPALSQTKTGAGR